MHRVSTLDRAAKVSARLVMSDDYGRTAGEPWRRAGDHWLSNSRWVCRPVERCDRRRSTQWGRSGPAWSSKRSCAPVSPTTSCSRFSDEDLRERADDADALWRDTAAAWKAAVPSCQRVPAGRDVRRSFAVLRGLDRSVRSNRRCRDDVVARTRQKRGATTTTATPGSVTPAISDTLVPPSKAGRPFSTTPFAGSAPGCSATGWIPCRPIVATAARCPVPARWVCPATPEEPTSWGTRSARSSSSICSARCCCFWQMLRPTTASIPMAGSGRDRRCGPSRSAAARRSPGSGRSGPDHWTHSRLIAIAGLRSYCRETRSRPMAHQGTVVGR